jgi:hypothetical protein
MMEAEPVMRLACEAKKVFEARRLALVDKIFAQIGKGHGESGEPFKRSASAPAG